MTVPTESSSASAIKTSSLMSGGEMMIANISVQDIPIMDIVICVGLVVIMSGVPIIPIARANNIINKN